MLLGKIIILGIIVCSLVNQLFVLIRELKKCGVQVYVIMILNVVNFVILFMVQREVGILIQIDQFEFLKVYDMNY